MFYKNLAPRFGRDPQYPIHRSMQWLLVSAGQQGTNERPSKKLNNATPVERFPAGVALTR